MLELVILFYILALDYLSSRCNGLLIFGSFFWINFLEVVNIDKFFFKSLTFKVEDVKYL